MTKNQIEELRASIDRDFRVVMTAGEAIMRDTASEEDRRRARAMIVAARHIRKDLQPLLEREEDEGPIGIDHQARRAGR